MSEENTVSESGNILEEPRPKTKAELRQLLWERFAWWFKLITQPLIAVGAFIVIVAAFGLAQRMGWIPDKESGAVAEAAPGEEVLYICPMVCVPPATAPGKCPVCGMDLKAQKQSGDARDKYGLKLDPASIRVANIQTTVAESEPLVRQIRTIGEISYNEGSLATISAYVDGRIDSLFADYTGVDVREGDELALLYSPDLYSSQTALIEALKFLNENGSANEQVNRRNREFYESARQRLLEFGMTEEQVTQIEQAGKADSRIRIVSPMEGTVIEKMVLHGQYVYTGDPIYKVADLSSVWLMLELFPRDAAHVLFGQRVVTKIQSIPGREFVGRVAFIDPVVDSETQTIGVRVVIPNEDGALKIGDFATAVITATVNTPHDRENAVYDPDLVDKWISPRHPHVISDGPGVCTECGMDLVPSSTYGYVSTPVDQVHDVVVPRDAVLMAGDDSVAYVETEPGRFEFRNVVVGQIVGDRVSIVEGVEAGERVVSGAALLVDSQFSMAGKPSLIDPTKAIPREPEESDPFSSPEVMAALEELSDEDKGEVIAQKICPVTTAPLGSMGAPLPVDVEGRRVWICCDGCETGLKDDPEKYFAILDEAAAEEAEKQKVIDEAMAGLDADDRELAVAQKICPVANFPLGSMGTPIRVDVEGRPIFICCEGCRQSLVDDPQKYFDILDSGPVEGPPPTSAVVPAISALPQIQPLTEPDALPQMSLPQMTPPPVTGEESNDGVQSEPANVTEALSKLSAEDQRLARAQRTCPVAAMPLGSMGTPIKVDINGRDVFICCEGCRSALLRSPDKYLARLRMEADE